MSENDNLETVNEAMKCAMKLIAASNKSSEQIKRVLRTKGYAEEVILETLEQLRYYNYVDDIAFANNYVTECLTLKIYGRLKIKYELNQKGISSSIIEQCLSEMNLDDEIDCALRYITQRNITDEMKITRRLLNRGFSFDIIDIVKKKIGSEMK